MVTAKRITDIDPLEISLVERPKNRRPFLALHGEPTATAEVQPELTSTLPPEIEADAVRLIAHSGLEGTPITEVTAPSPTAAPVEEAVEGGDLVAQSLARRALSVVMPPGRVAPAAVRQAIATIVQRAGVAAEPEQSVLDEEHQVHVQSFLALIPADAPPDILSAATVVRAWVDGGYPLEMMPDMPMMKMPRKDPMGMMEGMDGGGMGDEVGGHGESPAASSTPPKRVVTAEKLTQAAQDLAAELVGQGQMKMASEVYGFLKSIRKALPEGGLVVVGGVVANDGSIPMVHLAEVWQSGDADTVAVIQAIIDAVSTEQSQAAVARREAEPLLQEFARAVAEAIGNDQTKEQKMAAIQSALNGLGERLPDLVTQSCTDGEFASGGLVAALQQQIAPVLERLERLEKSQARLQFGPPPPPAPVSTPRDALPAPIRKSLRSAIEHQTPRLGQRFSISQIVEQTNRRRSTLLP